MKRIIRFKAFWVCIFFLIVALVSNCWDLNNKWDGVYIEPSSPPHGCRNVYYSYTFIANNNWSITNPSYVWSIRSGTKPPGLNLDANTGELSGTPTTNGKYSLQIQVKEQTSGDNFYEDYSISIADFNITNGDSEAVYCPGIPFEYQFNTCGETGTLTWTIKSGSGSPPSGISFSSAASGKLSGTTSATGEYSFTVDVADSGGGTSAEKDFKLFSATSVQIVSSSTLPKGQTSKTYTSYQLEACGGTAPYTWTDPNSDVPLGLTLGSSGLITGTPTKAGTHTFLIRAKDSASSPRSDSKYFTLVVAPSALAIATASSLASATECTAYSTTLSATGGTGSYSWKFASATQKPSWLSLSSLGVLSGTPTTPTSTPYSFTIELSDGKNTVSQAFQLSVAEYPAVTSALSVPEIRHGTGSYNTVSLSVAGTIKVDFRFSSTSYLKMVVTAPPATLQVIGNCSVITTTNFNLTAQDINSDGLDEIVARFDPSQVAGLLSAIGKTAGDSATLRFTVSVKDVTVQTFVQTAKVSIVN